MTKDEERFHLLDTIAKADALAETVRRLGLSPPERHELEKSLLRLRTSAVHDLRRTLA